MSVHLIKLAVGIEDLDHLDKRQRQWRDKKAGHYRHWTRMTPQRGKELLDGGSLYWVIKGSILVRQPILGFGEEIAEIAPDAPGYVEAVADRIRTALDGAQIGHLILSYHGIPVRYDRRERGLYPRDCRATTGAVLARLGWPAERATLDTLSRLWKPAPTLY